MNTYGGVTSALEGGDWSASRPDRFNHEEKPHYTFDRLRGPQSRIGRCGEEKILMPRQEPNSGRPGCSFHYTDRAIPAPNSIGSKYKFTNLYGVISHEITTVMVITMRTQNLTKLIASAKLIAHV
jgi:hypothetical protein